MSRRNKNQISNINIQADEMLKKIEDCVNTAIAKLPSIKTAVVQNVNDDGTVDIYFPPDKENVFTKIQNQSIHKLSVGDGVELLLKDGTYNNCWIIAKHK